MQLLTYLARRFAWQTHSKTLPEVEDQRVDEVVEDAVVVFLHVEPHDVAADTRARSFRHALKHVKWLAGKRGLRQVVLHSFAHLGGDNADPAAARALMVELAERLEATGYAVALTPFGYFCSWDLSVYGESLAKVWKQI